MAEQRWIYDEAMPDARAGSTIAVTPQQTLDDLLAYVQGEPEAVHLRVDGPRFSLTPEDIAGVYPAPGSTESPDEFLPHIALRRRTLPWERHGPQADSPKEPWLALLLLSADELDGAAVTPRQFGKLPAATQVALNPAGSKLKVPDDTEVKAVTVTRKRLKAVLPKGPELPLLCHVKRTDIDGVREDTAIIVGNRLPDASKDMPYTALLVSLENRGDVYDPKATGPVELIVLHHWTFKPSTGGDFEQVIKAIGVRPNGGVLRFGNLPRETMGARPVLSGGFAAVLDRDGFAIEPLDHTQPSEAIYRGPLRPFAPPPRDRGFAIRAEPEEFVGEDGAGPQDYSHAAAFELGRLLAVHDDAIRDDLHGIRVQRPPLPPIVVMEKQPPDALARRDWIVNDDWYLHRFDRVLEGHEELRRRAGVTDVTGVAGELRAQAKDVVAGIEQLRSRRAAPIRPIDVAATNGSALSAQFAAVRRAADG